MALLPVGASSPELGGGAGIKWIAAGFPDGVELTMEGAMFSVFWLLAAFVLGGLCGVFLMAVMNVSAGLPKQSTRALQAQLRGLDLGGATVV